MEEVLLVRHAESDYNRRGLINADPNGTSPLTDLGRQQAETLGRLLATERIELCVTSEIPRAVETAEIVLRGRDIPSIRLAELNDPLAGRFEGRPVAEYAARLREKGRGVPNPGGGESQIDALRRYLAAYRWLLERPERRVLLVAHALPIAWLKAALGERSAQPEVDFEKPGVPFAREPLLLTRSELERAIPVLEDVVVGT